MRISAVQDAQEQVLATIKQGQELALAGVQLWASSVAPLVKDQPVSIPLEAPPQGDRRRLVRLRREAARLAEGVRREGRRRVGAGLRGAQDK